MRSLSKGRAKEPVKMKFGKTRFARGLPEENTGLVLVGKQVAPAAQAAEGIVMKKVPHAEIILPLQTFATFEPA